MKYIQKTSKPVHNLTFILMTSTQLHYSNCLCQVVSTTFVPVQLNARIEWYGWIATYVTAWTPDPSFGHMSWAHPLKRVLHFRYLDKVA